MTRVSFAREVITRLRYPTVDDLGTAVPDYTAEPAELEIQRCWLEPIESQEIIDGRLAVQTGFTGTAPPDADLLSTDHVRYRGVEYEMAGDAIPVPSPTGALDEVKFSIRRWQHAG